MAREPRRDGIVHIQRVAIMRTGTKPTGSSGTRCPNGFPDLELLAFPTENFTETIQAVHVSSNIMARSRNIYTSTSTLRA